MGGNNDNAQIEMKHPLSTWEKVKIGVKSFVKGAASYVPRALIMVPITIGAMALLANATDWGLLSGFSNMGLGGFLQKVAIGIGLGSAITGGFMAYQSIQAEDKYRNQEVKLQQQALQRLRSQERERQQEPEITGGFKPQSDLPTLAATETGMILH